MRKKSPALSEKQARELLNQLSPSLKIRLVRQWEKETWPARLNALLAEIRHRVRRNPRLAHSARRALGPRRAHAARRPRH